MNAKVFGMLKRKHILTTVSFLSLAMSFTALAIVEKAPKSKRDLKPVARQQELDRFTVINVNRSDLNHQLPSGMQVGVGIRGQRTGYDVSIRVKQDIAGDGEFTSIDPYLMTWVVKPTKKGQSERKWWVGTIEDRDGTVYTKINLPKDELKRSEVHLYFETIEKKRLDLTVIVDLAKMDWELSQDFVWQEEKE